MTSDPIAEEAEARARRHAGSARFGMIENENLIGMRGEQAFGELFDLPVDLTPRPEGDAGFDFRLPLRIDDESVRVFEVDVKTISERRFPSTRVLMVDRTRIKAQRIYVLAEYFFAVDRATLRGWEWGSVIMRSPIRNFGGAYIESHWIKAASLRRILELMERYHDSRCNAAD